MHYSFGCSEWLSVPLQLIAWKASSCKWHCVWSGILNTASHSYLTANCATSSVLLHRFLLSSSSFCVMISFVVVCLTTCTWNL